jgi:tRNA1Val (adenine37-N6)-methyltransferase
MEYLPNGYTLDTAEGSFPLSTDSMILAHFVKLPKNATVLDLGSGCGTLVLLLCAGDDGCRVTGLELTEAAHRCALDNIHRNDLETRMVSICGDLRSMNQIIQAGSFRCCVSNPPYFSGGVLSKATPLARRNDTCSTQDMFQAAAWALQWGCDFYLVHKPENLARICTCACENNLEPKRLRLIRHQVGGSVKLILLQCRKGGKPGLIWEEEALHDIYGNPTDYYKRVYHLT